MQLYVGGYFIIKNYFLHVWSLLDAFNTRKKKE